MKSRFPKYHKAYRTTLDRSLELRRDETSAEHGLWQMVRNRQVLNAKFRRQHAIGPFIADFYCHEYQLVIELDGDIHKKPEVKENDLNRQEYLEGLELYIMRFTNDHVFDMPETVIERIKEFLIMKR